VNLLDALCRDWVTHVAKDYRPDCCIAATAIGSEALRYFGVAAEPVASDVVLFNPEAWELQNRGVPVPEWPSTAWSLGVQREMLVAEGRDGFCGHLVIIIGDLLVDLSAAQFDRPKKGLRCDKPLILDGGKWDDEAGRMSFGAILPDGTTIIYWLRPENRAWKAAPDWKNRAERAGPMIRRLRSLDIDSPTQGAQT